MKIKRDKFYLLHNNTVARCIDTSFLRMDDKICILAVFDSNKKIEQLEFAKENGKSVHDESVVVLKEINALTYKDITATPKSEKSNGTPNTPGS